MRVAARAQFFSFAVQFAVSYKHQRTVADQETVRRANAWPNADLGEGKLARDGREHDGTGRQYAGQGCPW